MPAETVLFSCLKDNFGVLLHDPVTGATAAIDAPEAGPVEIVLRETGWKLTDILVTHHHADHTDGIMALKERHKCRVVGPEKEKAKIPGIDETVREGDVVTVGNLKATVIETPGHTLGHISYWLPAEKIVFVGDTLFSIGCGRVIEGTPAMMWKSLAKLRDLPDETTVYCGHEYTAANVKFALSIDGNNADLKARAAEVERQRSSGDATIPITIGAEKKANPFLRPDAPALARSVGMESHPAADVFAEIRGRKDRF